MDTPDFWRTEIWHPLSVHFPLAMLLFGTFLLLIGFFPKNPFWENMGKLLLLFGTATIWVSIYTGHLAGGIVSRQICDPTVLETHETNGTVAGWLFLAVSVLIAAEYVGVFKKAERLMKILIIGIALTGAGFVGYTGHLGATLVYQQAAGVYTPTENCVEFSD